jgi:hypothetical protein
METNKSTAEVWHGHGGGGGGVQSTKQDKQSPAILQFWCTSINNFCTFAMLKIRKALSKQILKCKNVQL